MSRQASPDGLTIRAIRPADWAQWRSLWQQYLDYYQVSLQDSVTSSTWNKIMHDPDLLGIAAEHSGSMIGFGLVVVHAGTWTATRHAYLEDLYVQTEHRGKGVGRAIIDEILVRARANAWASVYWHTGADNRAARLLYDRYCSADDVVRYRIYL